MTYSVTRPGKPGSALEIHCDAHPDCTWRMQSAGARSEADPVFRAQWENHMKESRTPDAKAFGHQRRSRQ